MYSKEIIAVYSDLFKKAEAGLPGKLINHLTTAIKTRPLASTLAAGGLGVIAGQAANGKGSNENKT